MIKDIFFSNQYIYNREDGMGSYAEMWRNLGLDVELHEEVLQSIGANYGKQVLSQSGRPEGMRHFDEGVHESHGGRVQEIIEAREKGAKMIGTFCIYVPDEIAIAAGAIPVALCGGTNFSVPYAEKSFPRDICPLVKSTLGLAFSKTCPYAPIKDLGVGESTCDAKKKTWDILSKKVPFHILELPQKKNGRDMNLWREEIGEFRSAVEELTGVAVTAEKLKESIALLNRRRRLLAEMNEFRKLPNPPISGTDALVVMQTALNVDPARFCDNLEELNEELRDRVDKGISPFDENAPRIMVAGCPTVMGNWMLHHLIESSGAAVVCDESCTGTRFFEHLVDESGDTVDELIDNVAERYFKIDCSCFTPNDERITHVPELAREYSVDAVVQYVLQYCHTYNIEAIRIAGALQAEDIPAITIETDYGEEHEGQLRTRIEALLERVTLSV